MIDLEWTIFLTLKLTSITFILSGLEFLILKSNKSFMMIWSFDNLRSELESGLPLPPSWISMIFSDSHFKYLVTLQLISATLLFFYSQWVFVLFLLITHLIICIRFRGTFNGGSDMMKFVILTGALFLTINENPMIQKLGLYYVAIHMFLSYFKAGWSKLMIQDWRTGMAIPSFLSRSLFLKAKRLSEFLLQYPLLSQTFSWLVIVFELGIVVLIFQPQLTPLYFALAMVFHFTNYVFFGLNRFFWIWLCGWPALFYLKIL